MKHILLSGLLLVCCLSCKQGEVEYVDFDDYDVPGGVPSFCITKTEETDVLLEDGSLNPDIALPISEIAAGGTPNRIAATTAANLLSDLFGNVYSNRVVQVAGTYTGHDINGEPLVQSGKLIFPKKGKIKNLLIVSHYTIGANRECPSEVFPLEGLFATKGYAVLLADYIGYGVTAHRIHPYLHVESTARSVIDFALAVRPYLKHIGREPADERVILLGYSQGGAATLGVMRAMESEYSDLFSIKKVYAGAGPYDLTATFDYSMSIDRTGIPCAIPMIVQGISEGEQLKLNMEDFFLPQLLNNYDYWINSKLFSVREMNEMINVHRLSEIMTAEGRNKESSQTARLYRALMRNSILNFKPQAPLWLFHSRQDDTVPFINSEKAEEKFKGQNINFDFGNYGDHTQGFLNFFKKVGKDL